MNHIKTAIFATISTLVLAGCQSQAENGEPVTGDPQMVKVIHSSDATVDIEKNWPQWLGPNRNGVVSGATVRTNWAEKEPKIVWKIELGSGFSGISIVDNKAFTMASDGDNEFAVCLDARTGKEIWRYNTGQHFSDWQGGSGPRSTPSVDNGIAYYISSHGSVFALNANSGKLVWQNDLRKNFGAKVPQWGFSGSPLVDGNLVYVETGGNSGKALVAFDKTDGKVVWTSQSDNIGYSSPIIVTAVGVRQLIFFTGSHVMSVSPETGELFWKTPWETSYDVNAATPVFIAPNRLFISSEYGVGAAVFEMTANAGKISVQQIWKNREMKNKMATSIVHKGYVYGIDGSILKCIDAATGAEMWKARGYGQGSLILVGENLVLLGARGNVGLVEANPQQFNELGNMEVLAGRSWTVPTFVDGYLFVRNLEEAACIDLN